jgi:hypothetical protein
MDACPDVTGVPLPPATCFEAEQGAADAAAKAGAGAKETALAGAGAAGSGPRDQVWLGGTCSGDVGPTVAGTAGDRGCRTSPHIALWLVYGTHSPRRRG